MSTREEYNQCMKPYISGHHEDRKLSFCAGAKMCTGKASSLPEAEKLCREQPPKEPKPRKGRVAGKSCSPQSLDTIASCVIAHISFEADATTMNRQLRDSLALCMCGRKEKKLSKAEQAVMSLDAGQREALIQFMSEHGTSAKKV